MTALGLGGGSESTFLVLWASLPVGIAATSSVGSLRDLRTMWLLTRSPPTARGPWVSSQQPATCPGTSQHPQRDAPRSSGSAET